jgi:biopolymer transport protein TolQ
VLAYNKLQSEVGKLQSRLEGFADEFSAILSRQIDERIGHTGHHPANAA